MTAPVPDEASRTACPPEIRGLVDALVASGGGAVRAVVLFGSQLVRASPDLHSAWDLVVVVDRYGPFHRALVAAGHHRRPAWLLSALGRVLPPNITAFQGEEGGALAKCAIVSAPDFVRALGPRARDHFLKGRMVQQVAPIWTRSAADSDWVDECLAAARRDVLRWAGPYLEEPFTGAGLAHRMLQVSYAGELRPERSDRVEAVFQAQRAYLTLTFETMLEEAERRGRVRSVGEGRFVLVPPPGPGDRLRTSLYFAWSKVRATLRWGKHILTFNDWLTYIQKKVERRTGLEIEVSTWERRLPLLLLWPKVFRVLTAGRTTSADPSDES